mmetsp:Transcript_118528/g.271926  ORF Transcript_118528/g.271926 Transcript_118528/m.271926 type:complete len:202 (-) Transcript_118528:961-1566(-)
MNDHASAADLARFPVRLPLKRQHPRWTLGRSLLLHQRVLLRHHLSFLVIPVVQADQQHLLGKHGRRRPTVAVANLNVVLWIRARLERPSDVHDSDLSAHDALLHASKSFRLRLAYDCAPAVAIVMQTLQDNVPILALGLPQLIGRATEPNLLQEGRNTTSNPVHHILPLLFILVLENWLELEPQRLRDTVDQRNHWGWSAL